jgi:DNA replication initiation complex subunit (GINS family)
MNIFNALKDEREKTVYQTYSDFNVKSAVVPRKLTDLATVNEGWLNEAEAYFDKLFVSYKEAKGNEIAIVSDEVRNALDYFEGWYNRRIGKIIEIAQYNSAGFNVETINMASHEMELYQLVYTALVDNRLKFKNRFFKNFNERLV